MKDIRGIERRSGLSREERKLRSRLKRLVIADEGMLRGNLSVRQVTCGKAGCKCTRGERHTSHVLVASHEGQLRQLYLPATLKPTVLQWIAHHNELRAVLEELSRIHWDKVKKREV